MHAQLRVSCFASVSMCAGFDAISPGIYISFPSHCSMRAYSPSKMRSCENKDRLIDLYNRIPDYSQVKHLGNSEFINTLEKLKEEFRQCRASLHELDSEVEYISQQTSKVLNISKTDDSSSFSLTTKNVNITRKANNNFASATSPSRQYNNLQPKSSYLSVRSCALHNPNELSSYSNVKGEKKEERLTTGEYVEDFELFSDELSTPESGISRWSSSPEIYSRSREVSPPANVERRLLLRRAQNNSAPSIPDLNEDRPKFFKANPVPEHVHKPLFDYIMLKNKRRSMRVREKSKQKLLSQMKPFSFPHDSKMKPATTFRGNMFGTPSEPLNNSRPTKKKKQYLSSELRNKFDHHTFRAHPAPPRSKALLSAIKLKEQQDYRELKKKLRAEALMKSASLPPSMAARDRVSKAHCSRLDELLSRFNSPSGRKHLRSRGGSSIDTDEDLSDDDIWFGRKSRPGTSKVASNNCKKLRNFTPYGEPRFPHSSATDQIFESTSNDNHASRLRVQVAKARDEVRIKKEEEEMMRQMKMDRKRQKLRDSHALAWRIARSYSSSQDIAMRRQLRMAAAILERETYKRDMNSMLSRVRSAPLLLEGLRERKSEPCKKHREELSSGRKSPNKSTSPRRTDYGRFGGADWGCDKTDLEKSETAAIAEGSITTSYNESTKILDMDDGDEQGRQETLPKKQNITQSPVETHENRAQHEDDEETVDDYEDEIFESCE